MPCKTVGDAGRPCVFPFKYRDVTYDKCTSRDSDNGQPWCATEVDDEGYVVDNAWGDCLEGCPGSSKSATTQAIQLLHFVIRTGVR